jgi:integrase
VLEPHSGPPNALVFGFDSDYTSQTFRKACTDAGIVDFRFHDLRHTAASWLRMTGADIHSVATLLGHKDIRTTARYSHLNPAFLGETIAKLDGVFDNLRCQDVTKTLPVKKQLTAGESATVESIQLAAMV